MPAPRLTVQAAAELIAERVGLPAAKVREVLDAWDALAESAMVKDMEVEVGSFGFLELRPPVQAKPPRGEVTRGKRVAFRERDKNRHRFK